MKTERQMMLPKHKTGKELTSEYMNEVIFYGGLPMTRANVYRHALRETGSTKAADIFAFSDRPEKVAPPGTRPLSIEDMDNMTGHRISERYTRLSNRKSIISGRNTRITPRRQKIGR